MTDTRFSPHTPVTAARLNQALDELKALALATAAQVPAPATGPSTDAFNAAFKAWFATLPTTPPPISPPGTPINTGGTVTVTTGNTTPVVVPPVPAITPTLPLPNAVSSNGLRVVNPFDGISRLAREVLWNTGVCGDLTDATAAQYAAALKYTRLNILRGGYINQGASRITQMQAVRTAQTAAGDLRQVKYVQLVKSYNNDLTTPLSAQFPLMLSMILGGLLIAVEGLNESNNYSVGNGHRGPEDSVDKTQTYADNELDWQQRIFTWRNGNASLFSTQKVLLIGPSIASGLHPDYSARRNLEPYCDLNPIHFYAGNGFQPSLPFAISDIDGYYSNLVGWDAGAVTPTGIRGMCTTECGASTDGFYYATSGLSQAKYIMNQLFEQDATNSQMQLIYQMFDGSSTPSTFSGFSLIDDQSEGNYGIYKHDAVTPKPAATAIQRRQDILALGNNALSQANIDDWTNQPAFKPGLNAAQVAVTGIDKPPKTRSPFIVLQKSDGSSVIEVTHEPPIDSSTNNTFPPRGGLDLTVTPCPIVISLPRARNWRLQDPLGTASLTAGAWTFSQTIPITLNGYTMMAEIQTPPGWTASGGDPADVPLTGSTVFTVRSSSSFYARNYQGLAPDDQYVNVPAPSGGYQPGNTAVILGCTDNVFNQMTCVAATSTLGAQTDSGSPTLTHQVWFAPINNPLAQFTVGATAFAASAAVWEIPPFSTNGYQHSVCSFNFATGANTITAPLIAVPSDAVGIWAVMLPDSDSAEVVSAPTDPTVTKTFNMFQVHSTFANAMFGGVIATGRAAGSVAIPITNTVIDPTRLPVVVSMWFRR